MSKQKYQPLVSIITPTYNHGCYIEQCIKSVLSQSYTNWEHIIIDDGSTDLTSQIILKYANDKRIYYIRQEHMGIRNLSKTYNKALSLAQGELIAILEGDDCWPPDKLEKQVPAFQDSQVVLTWGKGIYIDDKSQPIRETKAPSYRCLQGKEAFKELLIGNFVTPTVTVVVRKDVLLHSGFIQPKGVPWVDRSTWLEVIRYGKSCFINEVLGYWRIHPLQMSQKLWYMRKGELKTYLDLWRRKRISLSLFMILVPFSLAKHVRYIMRNKGSKLC